MNFPIRDMHQIVDTKNILFVTLDTLRFDVAQKAFFDGKIPSISRWLPEKGWEKRHSPANFTYAAHHAFFAGFLPTPIGNGPHPRLFAADFPGSESTCPQTFCFSEANLVKALANRGYQTCCIGGVGFFNKLTPLGQTLPSFFQESFWSKELGVTCRDSAQNQVKLAKQIVSKHRESSDSNPLFLFINVSAIHQPNYFYLENASTDSPASQLAALTYWDAAFAELFDQLESDKEKDWFVIVSSDHGTMYGEDGLHGHRLNHNLVGDVPYTDFLITEKR